MSTSCDAKAMIGVLIEISRLAETKRVRGCEHETTSITSNYCQSCGKPIWVKKEIMIDGYEDYNNAFYGDGILHGLRVVYCQDEYTVIVAAICTERACARKGMQQMLEIDDDDILKARELLRSKLEPIGFWDESKFGLWVVMTAG